MSGHQLRQSRAVRFLIFATLLPAACNHPGIPAIRAYVAADPAYAALPPGPKRIDALYLRAVQVAGSPNGAIELLGTLSVNEGAALRHPFDTGLTDQGPLAGPDKTGHFFTGALWRNQDRTRLIPARKLVSYTWEVLGEIRSWLSPGDGFDRRDLWANRLGEAFADRLDAHRADPEFHLLPSDIIRDAETHRPQKLKTDPHRGNAAVPAVQPAG